MKKLMLLFCCCASGSLALAADGDPLKIYTNLDLNITTINFGSTSLDTGYGLALGAKGAYFFAQNAGALVGLDLNMLNGEKNGASLSATYLDIPVEFVYNFNAGQPFNALVGVGPYVGFPISKWTGSNGGFSADASGQMAYGLDVESFMTYQIQENFAIGGHVGFKYEFADLINNDDAPGTQKYWAISFGVGAKFL